MNTFKYQKSSKVYILLICALVVWVVNGQLEKRLVEKRDVASLNETPLTFVTVSGDHFLVDGKRYTYLGTNLWQAMNLGSKGPGGDRARLERELDRLKKLGVKNLRIVAASEGPDTEPGRIVPSTQPNPGKFDSNLLEGLDFVLAEMAKRDMRAILVTNNFWSWSGGMAQYVAWSTQTKIPYPAPIGTASWDQFMEYSSRFYSDKKALGLANTALKNLVLRVNKITGLPYADDPTIMSWELANEPRGMKNTSDFNRWILDTAKLIKSLDPHHLVTTGSEGTLPNSGIEIVPNHIGKNIDYVTTHIWAQNFGWYDPGLPASYTTAVQKMKDHLDLQIADTQKLKKPLVLEEFGFSRDKNSYDPASPVKLRDKFYGEILSQTLAKAQRHLAITGVNFWAWAGEARPPTNRSDHLWKVGDPFLGDPPHEAQGWYSIYDADASTLEVIRKFAADFAAVQ